MKDSKVVTKPSRRSMLKTAVAATFGAAVMPPANAQITPKAHSEEIVAPRKPGQGVTPKAKEII